MTERRICHATVRLGYANGSNNMYLSLNDDLECFEDGESVVIIPERDYKLLAEMKAAGIVSISVGRPTRHTHYYGDCPQIQPYDRVQDTITIGDPDFPVCPHCSGRGLTLKSK